MLVKEKDLTIDTRVNSHGGDGSLEVKNLLSGETMPKHARLVSVMTLNQGCSIGPHQHVKEMELYYILEGKATVEEDGEIFTATPGDVVATMDGHTHSIANTEAEVLRFVAIVFKED